MSERVLVLQITELTYQVGDPQPKKEVKAVYQVPKNVDFSAVQRFLREHGFECQARNLAMLYYQRLKEEPSIRFGVSPLDPLQ